ncbi:MULTISPECIES: hypothetical protein [Microcoleaceae]|uniref:hypothetical protein n=1 Tax=Microcoleaceae TaxID=1892252 RepID=UPI0018824650|nr:hypothetical protein [Tychonema sp. LEGE 06208]MBE9165051.1 hypothetical protein [Tychonema sp. LEGE 06208]
MAVNYNFSVVNSGFVAIYPSRIDRPLVWFQPLTDDVAPTASDTPLMTDDQ